MESVAVVLGTRPEIIKLATIVRLLGPSAWVIDTGQHYDANLNAEFFAAFGLPPADDVLGVGGAARGVQIGQATERLSQLFAIRRPAAVVVQGDTNSALSGALAANAADVPLVHIEAGLRSFDRAMPEEHNRVVIDHLSDLCLAPTSTSAENLMAERIDAERIAITGNPIVEALHELIPSSVDRSALLEELGLEPEGFILSTLHRPENVDDPVVLREILSALSSLPIPVVLPLHPRTRARADAFGLEALLGQLRVLPPIGYRAFVGLLADCAIAISDSGGVQEEVSVVKRPMLVVRRSTERPEVLGTFSELVAPSGIGDSATRALADLPSRLAMLATLPSPYGDGTASAQSHALILRAARGRGI